MLHADDVTTGLLMICTTENIFHCSLEIVCNKAVDNGIHTAIQTAECYSQVVDYHMMRHVGVEVHHHLSDVERCEADSEDDKHSGQQLDSPPSPLPALLHQAAISKGPHYPQSESHNDDEGQKELSDGEEQEL